MNKYLLMITFLIFEPYINSSDKKPLLTNSKKNKLLDQAVELAIESHRQIEQAAKLEDNTQILDLSSCNFCCYFCCCYPFQKRLNAQVDRKLALSECCLKQAEQKINIIKALEEMDR